MRDRNLNLIDFQFLKTATKQKKGTLEAHFQY